MKRKIICVISLILVVSLIAGGCKRTNHTPTPTPTSSNTNTPEATNSLTPQIKEGSPSLDSKPGEIYEIGRFNWEFEDRNIGEPAIWEILEIIDGKALMILSDDHEKISEIFEPSEIDYENAKLNEWLNLNFFAETFPYYDRHQWWKVSKTSRIIEQEQIQERIFLLSPVEKEKYFAKEQINSNLRPAMWYYLDDASYQMNESWDVILDYFIYALKTKNLFLIMDSLGVYSSYHNQDLNTIVQLATPEYEFLTKATIEDVNVLSKELNEYENGYKYVLDIIVSESDTQYFNEGSNLFDITIELSESNSITYFRPKSNPVEIVNNQSRGASRLSYDFYVHFITRPAYGIESLDNLNDMVPDKSMDETSYIMFINDLVRFLPTNEKSEFTPQELNFMTMNMLGIENIDFTKHSNYDTESEKVMIYGMGGTWYFASLDNLTYNEATGTTTVEISFSSDAAYTVVARSYRFELQENEDGIIRITSVRKTYDSGVPTAFGSI